MGSRQEIDFTHPAFRFHAERVIRKIVARYADHPAVIGFQVDNEPGLVLFHNHGVFQRFVDDLRHTYGDVEALNEAWGLVYWSHRLSTWADLWTPDGNYQPQYDLAWRTFQAKLTDRVHRLAGRHRARVRAATTSSSRPASAYERPAVDDANLTAAWTSPPATRTTPCRTRSRCPSTAISPQGWTTVGCVGACSSSPTGCTASKQAPFLVTETNAGAIGGHGINLPAFDGQWRQAAWALRRPRRPR